MTKVSNDNFYEIMGCVSSVAGGAWHLGFIRPYCLATVDFDRSVNPVQTRLCPSHYYLKSTTPKSCT